MASLGRRRASSLQANPRNSVLACFAPILLLSQRHVETFGTSIHIQHRISNCVHRLLTQEHTERTSCAEPQRQGGIIDCSDVKIGFLTTLGNLMGHNGPGGAVSPSSTDTINSCLVHGYCRPRMRHTALYARLKMQHIPCQLQTSPTRRTLSRAGAVPMCSFAEYGNSKRPTQPCTTAFHRHRASPSTSSRLEPPAVPQSSSVRHRCAPLDRRWQGQRPLDCLSDAVGPLAGSIEVAHNSQGDEEHGLKHDKASQPLLQVPWTAGKIFQVMFLWLVAFWVLGYFALPNSLDLLGLERGDLSARGQALMHLLLDLGELGATLFILWRCLRAYQPLALGWFRARARPLRSWLCPALLACAFFPLVNLAAARSQGWFHYDKELWDPNVLEQSLASGDMVSNAIYFVVFTVCAPVWEEAIFRGFLLPSLTKYMPVTAAVAVSALSFAGAHFSMQRFLPLVLLGIIFGTVLVRTRNLLPCVLLHSLWNAYIFWQLTCRGTVVL